MVVFIQRFFNFLINERYAYIPFMNIDLEIVARGRREGGGAKSLPFLP
jgi:hypothetical protein